MVLRFLEEVFDLACDVRNDAVLRELQRPLERGEGLEMNRSSSLSRSADDVSTVESNQTRRHSPECDKKRLQVGTGSLEEEHVDDDLRELREVVDHLQSTLDIFAHLLDEQVVECLRGRR